MVLRPGNQVVDDGQTEPVAQQRGNAVFESFLGLIGKRHVGRIGTDPKFKARRHRVVGPHRRHEQRHATGHDRGENVRPHYGSSFGLGNRAGRPRGNTPSARALR